MSQLSVQIIGFSHGFTNMIALQWTNNIAMEQIIANPWYFLSKKRSKHVDFHI